MARHTRPVPAWKDKRFRYRLALVAQLKSLAEHEPELRKRLLKMARNLLSCRHANRDDEANVPSGLFPCGLVELCSACRRVQCYHLGRAYQAKAELLASRYPSLRALFVTIELDGDDPFAVDQELSRLEDAVWQSTRDPTSAFAPIVGILAMRDVSLKNGRMNIHRHWVVLVDYPLAREMRMKSGFRWAPQSLTSLLRRVLANITGRETAKDAVHVKPLHAHTTDELAVTLPTASPSALGEDVRRAVGYSRQWNKPRAFLHAEDRIYLALSAMRAPGEECLSNASRPRGLWRGVKGWRERKAVIQEREQAGRVARKLCVAEQSAQRPRLLAKETPRAPGRPRRDVPAALLVEAYRLCSGNIAAVARALGVPRRTVGDHVKRLDPRELHRGGGGNAQQVYRRKNPKNKTGTTCLPCLDSDVHARRKSNAIGARRSRAPAEHSEALIRGASDLPVNEPVTQS